MNQECKNFKIIDYSKQLKTTNKHTPVSVSVNSIIEGYDQAYFICNEKPEVLIDDFIIYIHNISLKAEELIKITYNIEDIGE